MDEPPVARDFVAKSRFPLHWRLFALSFIALFLELMVIRWSPSVVRLIAYYANLMLISSFFGLGLGAMLAAGGRRRWFAWFPVLLAIEIAVLWVAQHYVLPSSPTEARFYAAESRAVGYVVLVAIFASNALVFVPLGQQIGEIFQALPPLRAYAWDLGGSLAGTVAFGVFSFTRFSPIVGMAAVMVLYLALSPARRWLWTAPVFAAVLVAVWRSNDPNAIWSPYYYITVRPLSDEYGRHAKDPPVVREPVAGLRRMHNPLVYSVSVNQDFYQVHGTLDIERYDKGTVAAHATRSARDQYFIPYHVSARHDRVAVLGAGGGMDVEAALLNGAAHVDAVEIDPRLVSLSRQFNASGVYDSPNVRLHVTDARAFLRGARGSYDMIVFGYLDSQALFSYMTNLRLDGYIYTIESFRRAWELLDEDGGTLALSFTVARPWLCDKLVRMVTEATGRVPSVWLDTAGPNAVIIATRGATTTMTRTTTTPPSTQPAVFGTFHPSAQDEAHVRSLPIPLATDDWPYLYLAKRTVPRDYVIVIGLLVALSCAGVLAVRGRSFGSGDWHFLFLGLGFLLLETKSIADCSLYFGATWLVTTVVITGILLMVLAANLVAMRWTTFSPWLYVPLIASLLVLMVVPRDWVLALPLAARFAWALLAVPLPIFFAGLVFSTTFRLSANPAGLFGANLIGAMIGGFCEYLGMAVGHHALMYIVIAAYLASVVSAARWRGARV